MKVILVSQKKLTEDQIFLLGKKYNFDPKIAEILTDESVKAGVIVKVNDEVFIDNIEDSANVLTVTTANEISNELIEKISKKFGIEKEKIQTKIDTNILGGIVIKYKNKLFDGSLKSQVNELRLKLNK